MIELVVGPAMTKIVGLHNDPDLREMIKDVISGEVKGAQYSKAYKNGFWDGRKSLLQRNNTFFTGLLPLIEHSLAWHDINYTKTEDIPYVLTDKLAIRYHDKVLRSYQYKAAKAALNIQRGVLKMATNAGKTLVSAAILNSLMRSGIVVVPGKVLLRQTAEELEKFLGGEVGRYGAGHHYIRNATVTTVASLPRLIRDNPLYVKDVAALIIDECHHAKADTLKDNCQDILAPVRIGMSATPLNYDVLADLTLMGLTGDIIHEITAQDLISAGYSTDTKVFFTTINEPELGRMKYQTAYTRGIIENDIRNQRIAHIAEAEREHGIVVILTDRIAHCLEIKELIEDSYAVFAQSGSDLSPELAMQFMKEKLLDVIIMTPMFGEGISINNISTVIMADSGKGHKRVMQRIGRGQRKDSGKKVLHVYDFWDKFEKRMLQHSRSRLAVYESEMYDVEFLD